MACPDCRAYDSVMRRADALNLIDSHRDELRALGVRSLSIFGSVARDEARTDSDIDLLAEFTEPIGTSISSASSIDSRRSSACVSTSRLQAAYAASCATPSSRRPFVPPRDWRLRIRDIVQAVERIETFTRGLRVRGHTAETPSGVLR